MGAVNLSAELRSKITSAALAPFQALIKTELARIVSHDELHHLVRLAVAPPEEVALAEQLHGMNPKWMLKHTSIALIHNGHQFEASVNDTCMPFPQWGNGRINVEAGTELDTWMVRERQAMNRANHDANELRNMLDQIFSACTTLKQAEQVLPTIMQWVPEEDLVRYRKPTVVKKRDFDPEVIRGNAISNDAAASLTRRRMTQE